MIYFDHNATTPVRPEVLEAMIPFLREDFGNPNSPYWLGQRARKAVELARERVAVLLGAADSQEIVFTSCGSESDVMAISGAAWAAFDESSGKRAHLVSSAIEHDAVRGILKLLSRRGFRVDLAGVDSQGRVDAAEAASLVGPATALVSVMHANNEVGTVQPIEALAALCREKGALLHADAVQSAGKIPIEAAKWGVDLLSISGHKLNAPKGVGALYARKGLRLAQTITGHQEKNRRGGTENVASIVGLGAACELARKEMEEHAKVYQAWHRKLVEGVLRIPRVGLNGHPSLRLWHCAHFSFEGLDGHHLVVALDMEKICVSSGPACSTGSSLASHVLTAMGVPAGLATGSLRVSFGYGNSEAQIDRFLEVLPRAVSSLRQACSAGAKP
ncbi:MAG: cysteine desulfurase [Elusimicrobia bacterium]|nr:cysteine desulfurase [Elusimicrobiota bacterium]